MRLPLERDGQHAARRRDLERIVQRRVAGNHAHVQRRRHRRRQTGQPGDRRQRAHRWPECRSRQKDVHDTLGGRDVLRQLDLRAIDTRQPDDLLLECAQRVHRCRKELAGRGRIAQGMRAFAIETDPPALHVQPRAHAIAVTGRRLDRHVIRQRAAADARERVADDVDLQRQLPLVAHVREDVAAARTVVRRPRADRATARGPLWSAPRRCRAAAFRRRLRPIRRGWRRRRARSRRRAARSCGRRRRASRWSAGSRSPGCITRSVEAESRQAEAIADAAARTQRSPRGETRPAACARETAPARPGPRLRLRSAFVSSRISLTAAISAASSDRKRSSTASRASPRARRASGSSQIELARRVPERVAKERRGLRARLQGGQPCDRPFDMCRKGRPLPRGARLVRIARAGIRRTGVVARCRNRHAHGPPPVVERIQHVGITEFDAHRPPPRPFPVVALEIPIDAGARHLQRNPARFPAGHDVERRPDNRTRCPSFLRQRCASISRQ